MKRLLILTALLFSINSNACLNLSGTNLDGEFHSIDFVYFLDKPTDYPLKQNIYSKLSKLFERLENRENLNDDLYTDIAAYYIYDGQYKRAIDLLHKKINNKETNYNFCSNIGVAYELVGQLDSALYWTKKGLELNEESHNNSEWIHVRILEIELEMQKNKNWLDQNSIFNFKIPLDSNFIDFPDTLKLHEFVNQLGFQLNERTFFVKPKHQDILVARLILILADGVAKEYDTHESKVTYLLAAQYDTTLIETVNMRLAHISQIEEKLGLEHYEYTDANGLTITNDAYKEKHIKAKKTIHTTYTPKNEKNISFWIIILGIGLLYTYIFYRVFKK